MGIAVLAEIMARVTGSTCSQFLHDEFFDPLGMSETALGAPDDWFTGSTPKNERIPEAILIEEQTRRNRLELEQPVLEATGGSLGRPFDNCPRPGRVRPIHAAHGINS